MIPTTTVGFGSKAVQLGKVGVCATSYIFVYITMALTNFATARAYVNDVWSLCLVHARNDDADRI